MAPLVVTLLLDDAAQRDFDRLRAAYFPAERNRLTAHVTLFHALPGGRVDDRRCLHSGPHPAGPAVAAPAPPRGDRRGLGVWHYRGGPWEPEAEFSFC